MGAAVFDEVAPEPVRKKRPGTSGGPIAALALAAVVLGGCSSPPDPKHYTLRGDEPLGAGSDGARSTAAGLQPGKPVVLLDRFAIDDAYASERIAYREGAHELGYDPYALWAGAPVSQVEDAVRDLLWASGAFSDVRQPAPLAAGRGGVDLVITGRIARLEEVDAGDQWKAALDVELYLCDGKTREVLAQKRFASSEPAARRNPRDVVVALAHMLREAVEGFVAEARPAIEAHKPRGS